MCVHFVNLSSTCAVLACVFLYVSSLRGPMVQVLIVLLLLSMHSHGPKGLFVTSSYSLKNSFSLLLLFL